MSKIYQKHYLDGKRARVTARISTNLLSQVKDKAIKENISISSILSALIENGFGNETSSKKQEKIDQISKVVKQLKGASNNLNQLTKFANLQKGVNDKLLTQKDELVKEIEELLKLSKEILRRK